MYLIVKVLNNPDVVHILWLTVRQCDPLDIDNGDVVINVGQNVEGAIATYTCDSGYRLNNVLERVCQGNGKWNGSDPICQGIHHDDEILTSETL